MNAPKILETFALRGPFPGLGNLLAAVNLLLASEDYILRMPLDSQHPQVLQICLFGYKSRHPVISVQVTLDDSISQERIFKLINTISSGAKKSHSKNFYIASDDDHSIRFFYGNSFDDVFVPYQTQIIPSKIVHQHTFEFRKFATGLYSVVSAISELVNKKDVNGEYLYSLQATLDPHTNRWFQLQLKYKDKNEATLMLSRRLKSVTNEDIRNLTKLNFASVFDAPIEFNCDDNIHLTVVIGTPEDEVKNQRMLDNFGYLGL